MRITIDIDQEVVKSIDFLRKLTGARSRGVLIKWAIEEAGRRWAGRPAGWATGQWEIHRGEGGKDEHL